MVKNIFSAYTFEDFVTGPSNRSAYAAAVAVAEQPAQIYNPFFLHGQPGLGKSHLLHAIICRVNETRPALRACYISAADFLDELFLSLRKGHGQDFKRRYWANDLLVVDDLHLFAGKLETQQEFLYFLNSLCGLGKQAVLASTETPRALKILGKGLGSCFERGYITEIRLPERATRLGILRKKAEGYNIEVPAEVRDLIAAHLTGDVRELEGALKRITAFAALHGLPVTLQLASKVLADNSDGVPVPVTRKLILDATSDAFRPEPLSAK